MSTPLLDQIIVRAAAIEAFFDAVITHGHAEISCDMEDYGREPGDTVTVTVGLDWIASRTGAFTAEMVQELSAAVSALEKCEGCEGHGGFVDQQGNADECPDCHGSGVSPAPAGQGGRGVRYRSKPRMIEAEQFLPCESEPRGICRQAHDYRPHVHTMHQNQIVYLELGDWIVPEPDGIHYYPIRADVFAATYEPADDSPAPAAGTP